MRELFQQVVYVLCALTSVACAVMLFRGYLRSHARFLLWSSLCFLALMINNLMLFTDNVIFAGVETVWAGPMLRSLFALAGLALLMFGLVWDTE
jgi:hypothetical protein